MDAQRFVRRCLLSQWQPAMGADVLATLINGEIDWAVFQETVRRERIGPLLYDVLENQGWLPDWVESGLREAYTENAVRTAAMLAALEEILEALNGVGIEAVVLKGGALAGVIYPNPAVRFMTDLDLLVAEEDVEGVVTVLAGLGYKMAPELRPGHARRYRNELAMVSPQYPHFTVEPHWYLLDSPDYYPLTGLDLIKPYTIRGQFGDEGALVLRPELLLLHLCAHLTLQNRGSGLQRFWDVLRVLGYFGDDLDWALVGQIADKFQLVLPFVQTLCHLETDWGLLLPDIAKLTMTRLTATSMEHGVARRRAKTGAMPEFFAYLAALPTWQKRGGILWDMLVPAPSFMQDRYQTAGSRTALGMAYLRRWLGGVDALMSWVYSKRVG